MNRGKVTKFKIGPVIRALGGECGDYGSGTQKIRCINPDHPDLRPSMVVDFRNNRARCFSCELAGDGIELIMRLEGLSFALAVTRAEGITGEAGSSVPSKRGASLGLFDDL